MSTLLSPVPTKIITVAGGNLFKIAALYLNDATQWNRIARLNNMLDPFFYGITTLKIPAINKSLANGGIPYQ